MFCAEILQHARLAVKMRAYLAPDNETLLLKVQLCGKKV